MAEEESSALPASPPGSPPASGRRKSSYQFFRFFSTESTNSNYFYGDGFVKPEWNFSFWSVEFMLKVAQILVAIICTGLYTKGIKTIDNSITTQMFPNVIFSAFIIITSVIIISYVLGHVIPEVIIRIFNMLGAILYFVSAAITGQYWLVQGRFEAEDGLKDQRDMNMLLAETVLSFFNAFLYGIDVFFSMKKTLESLEIPPVPFDTKKRSSGRESRI